MVGDIITEYASQCIPNIWIHQCQMPSTKRYYCASWPERQYVVLVLVERTDVARWIMRSRRTRCYIGAVE